MASRNVCPGHFGEQTRLCQRAGTFQTVTPQGCGYPCLTCLSPGPDSESLGEVLSVVHSLRHGYAQAHIRVHLMGHVESKCTRVGAHTRVHTARLMIPHIHTHAHTLCLSHTLAHSHTCPTVPSSLGPPPPALAPGLVPTPLVSPLLGGQSPHKGGGARSLQSRMRRAPAQPREAFVPLRSG